MEMHLEDIILVPRTARLLEREPLEFELTEDTPNIRMAQEARRSLGQMAEEANLHEPGPGKLDKIKIGALVAYNIGVPPPARVCRLGKVVTAFRTESAITIQKYHAVTDKRLSHLVTDVCGTTGGWRQGGCDPFWEAKFEEHRHRQGPSGM